MSLKQFLYGLNGRGTRRSNRRVGRVAQGLAATVCGEILEIRRVLAGNVTVVLGPTGVLTFTGDVAANDFRIGSDASGHTIVTGNSGTTINGSASLDLSTLPEPNAALLNLAGGNDVLTLDTSVDAVSLPFGAVTINGQNGNDTVNVGTAGGHRVEFGSLTVNGGAGNDLVAFQSDLVLLPGTRAILNGGAGDDTYGFDADVVLGPLTLDESLGGIDTIDFSPTTTVGISINLGTATDQVVHATNLNLNLSSVNTFEKAIGGSGSDTLRGNALANTLTGKAGNDILNGAAGSDLLLGGQDNDRYVFGTALAAEADTVTEVAGAGTDTLDFGTQTLPVVLNLGTNLVQTVHTNRTLKLNSTVTFEKAIGGSGNDTLFGNSLANTLTGNGGNDTLRGAAGSDSLLGGPGDDWYVFGAASAAEADTVTEAAGAGTDTLDFGTQTLPVVLNLGTNLVQTVHTNRTLKLNSTVTFEKAIGGSGNDTLFGNSLANTLTGNGGNDILVGNSGNDQLLGGAGRDIMIGGTGLDILNGGIDEDILIAGRTTSDALFSNLNDLRSEWISANAYATRIANLRAGVGASAASLKAKVNVLNDAGEDDSLTGGSGTDWYFRAIDDVLVDLFAGETIDLL